MKICQSKNSCYKRLQPSRDRSSRWRGVGEASCVRLACQGGLRELEGDLVLCLFGASVEVAGEGVWGGLWSTAWNGLSSQLWEPRVFGPTAGRVTLQVSGSQSDVCCCHWGWRKTNRLERAFPDLFPPLSETQTESKFLNTSQIKSDDSFKE